MTVYYKFLDPDGRSPFGDGTWHLPDGGRPGKWMPEITGPAPGERGYHVVTIDQLIEWLGPELFEVECRGEHFDGGDIHVFGQVRLVRRVDGWNNRTARLFAAACAARVLSVFEACRPGDMRPHRAIEVARAFADGQAAMGDLVAARDAARDAAWDAAEAAASAAARGVAWDAAWDVAWDAAWAAKAAAGDAAWAAAEAAANDAVWAAARAAAAARDAGWAEAWRAAWDAEREWQARRLFQLIFAGHAQARQEEP